MSNNLLDPQVFYYHPLTRETPRPRRLYEWPDGVVSEEATESGIRFRSELTALDVATYYYDQIRLEHLERQPSRDVGGVKYMVAQLGLDITLFAIDALINHYLEADNRPGSAPPIIGARDLAAEAYDRLGVVKMIAVQYGVDERSYHAATQSL